MSEENLKTISRELKNQFNIIAAFVVLFWAIEIISQSFFGDRLDYFGIIPRNIVGLRGVILSPFLHADFAHLFANTFPFAILGWLVMLQETRDFFSSFFILHVI